MVDAEEQDLPVPVGLPRLARLHLLRLGVWRQRFGVCGLQVRASLRGFGFLGFAFGCWVLGFRLWGERFGVWSLGLRCWDSGLKCEVRVWGLGFWVEVLGPGIWGLGFGSFAD